MPWVEFTVDWDERLHRRQFRHHPAGSIALLRRDSAKEAIDRGAAELTHKRAKIDKAGRIVGAIVG